MSADRATIAWRLKWPMIVIALTVLDLRRERDDIKAGRDYVTGTTFSCFCRWVVGILPGGRRLFDLGLGWFCLWFRGHVQDPS